MNRRQFAIGSLATAGVGLNPSAIAAKNLEGKLGLVTASLTPHFSKERAPGKITLLDFPQFMQEELGLEIIDFNTMNFHSYETVYLEKLRTNIERFKCMATNLKLNQKVDFAADNEAERKNAMRAYKASIDAAALLGIRWVRPLPRSETPDSALLESAFDELIDYAGERGITVLIENFGWMMDNENSVIDLVKTLGQDRVGVGIDTGNWSNNRVRYPALQKTFPFAVTCDFKAKTFGANFEHVAYDLKRCFDIGHKAGFRGPWCLEHGHRDLSKAKAELIWMRENLEKWLSKS